MPRPRLTPAQALLVARGECGCACGRELPTVRLASGEVVVQPGRCWATDACRQRGHRQRCQSEQPAAERHRQWVDQAAKLASLAERDERLARRLADRARRRRMRALRLAELARRAA